MKFLVTFIALTVHAMSTKLLILTPGVDASSLHCVGGKSSTSGVDYFMKKIRKPWERDEPSMNELREFFEYRDGFLYWIKSTCHQAKLGERAGCYDQKYHVIVLKGEKWTTHRITWIYHYGPIPKGFEIDHKNQNKFDNNIENLRLATPYNNRGNTGLPSNNTSGHKGVYWHKKNKKWLVIMAHKKIKYFLGQFQTKEEAIAICVNKSIELLGEFSPYFNDKNNPL